MDIHFAFKKLNDDLDQACREREALRAEVERLTNKLNADSQHFELECRKAECDAALARASAAEAECQHRREETDTLRRLNNAVCDKLRAAEAREEGLRAAFNALRRVAPTTCEVEGVLEDYDRCLAAPASEPAKEEP